MNIRTLIVNEIKEISLLCEELRTLVKHYTLGTEDTSVINYILDDIEDINSKLTFDNTFLCFLKNKKAELSKIQLKLINKYSLVLS